MFVKVTNFSLCKYVKQKLAKEQVLIVRQDAFISTLNNDFCFGLPATRIVTCTMQLSQWGLIIYFFSVGKDMNGKEQAKYREEIMRLSYGSHGKLQRINVHLWMYKSSRIVLFHCVSHYNTQALVFIHVQSAAISWSTLI